MSYDSKNHYWEDQFNGNGALTNNNIHETAIETEPMADFGEVPVITQNRNRKRTYFICGVILFILLVIATLVTLGLLFLVQREVSFDLTPLAMENATINITPDGFVLPIAPEVHAKNDNYFDINLSSVDIKGFHPGYTNGTIPLGFGNVTGLTLHKRDTTTFEIPFLVMFNRTLDQDLTYFALLMENCSRTDNAEIYFDVHVSVDYKMWAKNGNMLDKREILVPCPITSDEAQTYKSLLPFAKTFGM